MKPPKKPKCKTDWLCSRACELGTKGCYVVHGPQPVEPDARPHKTNAPAGAEKGPSDE